MPFGLLYGDYLRNAPGLNASENASAPMSEADWNALPPDQQWGLLGYGSQGISVNRFDPRYQDLKPTVGGEADRSVNVMPGVFGSNTNNEGVQRFNDPSRVVQGDGYYSSSDENTTAQAQRQGFEPWKVIGAAAMPFLANAAVGALGLGSGGLLGSATGEAGIGIGASGAATADAAGLGGLAGSAAGSAGLGTVGSTGSPGILGSLLNGDFTGAASGVGNWALSHPLQALGAVQTVGGLVGHAGRSASNTSGSSGSKSGNGTGVPTNIGRPQFQPNPYLQAQLRAGGYIQ